MPPQFRRHFRKCYKQSFLGIAETNCSLASFCKVSRRARTKIIREMHPHLVAIVIALNNNSLRMLLGFLEIQNKQSTQIIFKMGNCQTNSENGSETYNVIRTNFCNGSNLLMCTIITLLYVVSNKS